jgi:hypothetical protein
VVPGQLARLLDQPGLLGVRIRHSVVPADVEDLQVIAHPFSAHLTESVCSVRVHPREGGVQRSRLPTLDVSESASRKFCLPREGNARRV